MPYYSINALVFSSRNVGWIAGYDWISQSGFVGRSTDAGLTWRKVLAGHSGNYKGLQFLDDLRGWVVGDGGTVASTADGGVTWSIDMLPHTRFSLESVSFIDKSNGWVAGDGGAILRLWADSTTTGVKLQPPSGPLSFRLYQDYPNPFNPTSTISYSLPQKSFVTLKLYDLLGREVRTLVNGEQEPGNHTRVVDANDLPSGVYFYRLQAGTFTDIKKMLMIK